MDAIVLVGGLGTRLRPLTEVLPKPALPLIDRPILYHLLDSLHGTVERIILACGYRSEAIERIASDYASAHGTEIVIVNEDSPLGTGGAIKNASLHGRGPFIVLNGDIISSLDMERFVEFHTAMGADLSIALWSVPNPERFGVVDIDGTRIKRFVEKPPRGTEPSNLINAGAYIIESSVIDLIPQGRKVSIEREIFPLAIDMGMEVHGYRFDGFWHDVGTPESYLLATEDLLRMRGLDRYIYPGAEFNGQIDGWGVVMDSTIVQKGAIIRRSVVFPDSVIGQDAIIEDAIVGFSTTVKEGSRIKGGIHQE